MPGFRQSTSTAALIAAVLVLLASASLYAESRLDPTASAAGPSTGDWSRAHLSVTGRARGLYPGARERVRVTVRNRGPRNLRLLRLRARIGAAGPACAADRLKIAPTRPRVLLRRHSSIRLHLWARMAADAADACQGARFPLRFRVRARAVR